MTVEVGLSTNNDIDGILWGWAWGNGGSLLLDFSFPTGTAEYTDNGYVSITGFSAFTAGQQAAVRTSLDMIESFSGLSFAETTNPFAVLRYAGASAVNYTNNSNVALNTGNHTIGTAEANPPELAYNGNAPFSASYAQGDSWYSAGLGANPGLGSFDFTAWIMHETGHNLGLKHGHVTQNGHGINFPMLPADHNSYEYSVMTYSQFPGDTGSGDNAPHHPTTYMQNDIAALQYLYGANFGAGSNSGNTVYTWSTATGEAFVNGTGQGAAIANYVLMTIWDGGGIDTYDLSNYTTGLSIDLNPGQWVVLDTSPARAQRANLGDNGAGGPTYFARGNIANALLFGGNNASLIENANGGSGNDTLTGNDIGNTLRGNGGNDTIDGKGGTDTAVFSGPRSQYATSPLGPGVQIADQRPGTPDGTDAASNVEFYQFTNRIYTFAEVLNQPPVLQADAGSPHPLTEIPGATNSGTPDAVSGALSFTDEVGDTHTTAAALFSATWPAGGAIPVGTQAALALAMKADSNPDVPAGLLEWQFSLADSFVDFLAAGETLDAVYDVTVLDQLLNSATRQVTIRFTGTNDTPKVNAGASDFAGSITELPGVTGSAAMDSDSGAVAFSDPDLNDRPTATIGLQTVIWQDISNDYTSELTAAQLAVFKAALQIAAQAGNTNVGAIDWDYEIVDSFLDFLAVDETITVFSAIVIDDGNGGTVSPSVTVTLYGSNDAPVGVPDSNGTAKNSLVTVAAAAGVLGNDSDPDVHDLDDLFVSQVNGAASNVGIAVAGTYGALTLQADGSYAYAAYKGSLPSKIVAQDTFTYTVADGHGGTDTSTLSFVVLNPGVSYQAGKDTTLIGGNGQDVLDGSAGGNVLLGGNGADVLIGGDGNTMTGGNGPDIFLFRPGFGANTVTDFNVNTDALQFDPSIFTDAADVLAHTTEISGNAVIDDGSGNTVTLVGVNLADLHSHTADFYFG